VSARVLVARVDTQLCVGTSNCAEASPEAYEMDEDSVPHALVGASAEAVLAGAEACPVGAISVYDRQTGERVYP
jgi:ferredoxin